MPKVSIIIPTFNRSQYIRAAIESVLTQSFRDYEIIVVDDGSTDDTETVLSNSGCPLNYVKQPHSGHPAVARNTGLRMAKGLYITFLDSDDAFLPNKLASQSARLDTETRLALVYSDAEYFTDEGALIGTLLKDLPPIQGQVLIPLLVDNFMATCSVMLRKSCLDTLGSFDESPQMVGVEDYDLWLRIAARYEVGFVEGISSRIRIHAQNISGGDKITQYLGILNALAKNTKSNTGSLVQYQRVLRERRALFHLAASRAYLKRGALHLGLAQFAKSMWANPDPHWLAYLVSTPHSAQTWLDRTMTRVISGLPNPNRPIQR